MPQECQQVWITKTLLIPGCTALSQITRRKNIGPLVIVKSGPIWGFPGGAVVNNPPANARDMGSSPGPGRSHMQWSN